MGHDPQLEMDQALEKAIDVERQEKRYRLSSGQLLSEQPGHTRYRFVLQSAFDLADESDLFLVSSALAQPLPVKLSHTNDTVITITTSQRLPRETLDHAELVVDRARLLHKMKEALNQPSTPAQLGLKLFGRSWHSLRLKRRN
jgi:hypothetical protein